MEPEEQLQKILSTGYYDVFDARDKFVLSYEDPGDAKRKMKLLGEGSLIAKNGFPLCVHADTKASRRVQVEQFAKQWQRDPSIVSPWQRPEGALPRKPSPASDVPTQEINRRLQEMDDVEELMDAMAHTDDDGDGDHDEASDDDDSQLTYEESTTRTTVRHGGVVEHTQRKLRVVYNRR